MSKIFTMALAAVALTSGGAALADTADQKTTEVVYADLDLATAEGVAELDRRINRAAQTVCRMDETIVGTRIQSREARKCYKEAKAQMDKHFARIKRDANYGG